MKSNRITSFLIYLSIFMVPLFISCSNDDEKEQETTIQLADLPQKAQTFISDYFKDSEINRIEEEMDGDVTVFIVAFKNGYEVTFNNEGDWVQVEAPFGQTIPGGIVPENVEQTLNERYNGYGVNEINDTGEGYHVVLTDMQGGNSIELEFNYSGEIVSDSTD